jgi:hypothetical protein
MQALLPILDDVSDELRTVHNEETIGKGHLILLE